MEQLSLFPKEKVMGMKPRKNEPQSTLAPNLVSGPKDTGESYDDYSNLVSSPKAVAEDRRAMPGNVLVSGGPGTVKNPG